MKLNIKVIQVTNFNEVSFNVRLVTKGEKFGLSNDIVHRGEIPLVEFYDTRYPHTVLGQFIARYYMDTLLEGDGTGLNLDAGVDSWYLDTLSMSIVRDWLRYMSE